MRDIEKLLFVGNLAASLVLGFRHDPAWFVLALAAFGLYVVLADRALRRRVGPRHWPSEASPASALTQSHFALRNLLLGALVFMAAGTFAGIVAA